MGLKFFGTLGLSLAAALCVAGHAAAQEGGAGGEGADKQAAADGTKEVTVTGEGTTADKARDDALRKAVEKGAGVVITSRTETLDHAVAFDKIVAKSEGYVSSFTVGSKTQDQATGIWKVQLTAQVATGKIKDDWGQIQLLLERKGQPTVIVLIREVVRDKGGNTAEGKSSYAATAIEGMLKTKGFRVKSALGLKDREKRERDAAVAKNDSGAVAALARTYGADIVISGEMLCRFDEQSEIAAGVPSIRYVAAAQLKAYRADTGDILASVDVDGYGRATGAGDAAQRAMRMASRKVKDQVLKELLHQWYFEFQHGQRFEVVVTITAKDAKKMRKASRFSLKFQNALQNDVEGIDSVKEESYAKEGDKAVLRLSVKTKLTNKNLRLAIDDLETEEFGYWIEYVGGKKALLEYRLHIE